MTVERQLLERIVQGYKSGTVMSSDKSGYINAIMDAEKWLTENQQADPLRDLSGCACGIRHEPNVAHYVNYRRGLTAEGVEFIDCEHGKRTVVEATK
jgi:hypothetical protein